MSGRELFERGEWLGEYEIIGRLRAGGMATLFLGRRHDAAGVSRSVVIKVIHPHLAEEELIVNMFIDEARISSHISHPNVVYIEKFGEYEGTYFMAMEYVDGVSLEQVLRTLQRRGEQLTPELATYFAIEAAAGLHAAHETTDEEGEDLGIVHRDVSPSNILITRSGRVKVIDFGIAKARNRLGATRSGANLKGKLRYMSPEQAWGRELDRRTDVFALGVVLWELLTTRMLFKGNDDLAVLDLVRDPVIPHPHDINPAVSSALGDVVLRATHKDVEARIATADELRAELVRALPAAVSANADAIATLVAKVRETIGVSEGEGRSGSPAGGTPGQRSSKSSPGRGSKPGSSPGRTPKPVRPSQRMPTAATVPSIVPVHDTQLLVDMEVQPQGDAVETSLGGAAGQIGMPAKAGRRSWALIAGVAGVLVVAGLVGARIATRGDHTATPAAASSPTPTVAAPPPVAPIVAAPTVAAPAVAAPTGAAPTVAAPTVAEPTVAAPTKPSVPRGKPTRRVPPPNVRTTGTVDVDGVTLAEEPTKPTTKPKTTKVKPPTATSKQVDVDGTVLSE